MAKREDAVWLHRGSITVLGALISRDDLPVEAVKVPAQHFLADVASVDPAVVQSGPDWVDVFVVH